MFGNLGFPELVMIFVVALLVFGPRRLPDIARQLGRWMAEFRRMTQEVQATFQREIEEMEAETRRPPTPQWETPPEAPPTAPEEESNPTPEPASEDHS